MSKDHPQYKEGIVGTGELVWKNVQGNPTIDKTQRAYQDAVGELVSSDTPDTKPTPAIGWKIDLKNTDGTAWLNDKGQPGWSTYRKRIDAKPVFTGRVYPLLLPKVAATLGNIQKKTGEPLNQTPEESLKLLQSDPEKYGTYLLASISHDLEKWLKKSPGFRTYNTGADISLEVFDRIGGEGQPGVCIKQGDKAYKIVTSNAYGRNDGRVQWSIFIDTSNSHIQDISQAKNFKLLPVGDKYFEAKICPDTLHYIPLSTENIALLESALALFKSLK